MVQTYGAIAIQILKQVPKNSGHEAIGIVEEIGEAITTVKPGDFCDCAIHHGCGECDACRAGFDGSCDNHMEII